MSFLDKFRGRGIKENLLRKHNVIKATIWGDLFSLCKIQNNKVIIDNFYGKGFGDNPKYIIEALDKLAKESDKSIDIVWILNKKYAISEDVLEKYKIRTVPLYSIKMIYEYCTSKIWIDNVKGISYRPNKRKEQYYIQVWHAGITFKEVEKAAQDTLSRGYILDSKKDSAEIDLFISDSEWVNKNYRKNFWYDGKIAVTGFPRLDPLFEDKQCIQKKVYDFYNLDKDTKIILYAPTFRQYLSIDDQAELYDIDCKKITDTFSKKFGGKFVVLKRLHPNVSDRVKLVENDYMKDGSRYPDMQELLVSSYAEICDFSSSIFDFMLICNRIFLYATDYGDYVSKERKLCFDIKKDLPFSFASNINSLCDNIMNYDEKKMSSEVQKLKDSFNLVEDGHASERVAKIVLDKMF